MVTNQTDTPNQGLLLNGSNIKYYSSTEDNIPIPEQQIKHVVIICPDDDFGSKELNQLDRLDFFDELPYSKHVIDIAKLSYRIIASEFLQNVLLIVSIYFVGNLGKNELAACALASAWFNIWNAMVLGMLTATDTYLSQTFGSKNYSLYGVWAANSVIVTVIASLPIAGLVAICGPVMELIGRETELARAAGSFAIRLVPGLLPYFLFKVLTKYLQAQNILAPSIWIGIIANVVNTSINWLLIYRFGWGDAGSPWATNFTRAAQFVFLAGYILVKMKGDQTWLNFSCQNMSYEVMQPFYAIALPGTIATSAQMWMGEALTILASALGTNALDAHTIVGNLCTFLFLSFPMAIGIAVSIRVGQLIGSQRPADAKKCFHASMFLCISTQSALIISLYSCKDWLSRLFTNDEEVSSIVLRLLSIMFIIMLGDTINVTIGGVLRGLGKQNWFLMSNLLPSWFFGIPMSIIFAFKMSLGIEGLWWGMLLGTCSSSAVGLIVMHWYVDWEDEAHQSLTRLSSIGQLSTSSKMTSSLASVASSFTAGESI